MEIDLVAVMEDLEDRRRQHTLTDVDRERYRACVIAMCEMSPAVRDAYEKWSGNIVDLRTSGQVVLAAVKAEDAAAEAQAGG